jgi:hypothetical protein
MIFVVSEKKAFEHFPIGFNAKRWLSPQVIVLTQDHIGKYRKIFFSEAIALIEPKLCINHWKVLYKLHWYKIESSYYNEHQKILTLFSLYIQYKSTFKVDEPLGQLKPNCPGIII